MKITHIGIWTKQLEVLRSFYTTYFQGKSHAKYVNPKKGFESYMLHFEGGCTLEIMSRTDVDQVRNSEDREFIGFARLCFLILRFYLYGQHIYFQIPHIF